MSAVDRTGRTPEASTEKRVPPSLISVFSTQGKGWELSAYARDQNIKNRLGWWLLLFTIIGALLLAGIGAAIYAFLYAPTDAGRVVPLIALALNLGFSVAISIGLGFQIRKWLASWYFHGQNLVHAARETARIARKTRELQQNFSGNEPLYFCVYCVGVAAIVVSLAHLIEYAIGVPASALISVLALPASFSVCQKFLAVFITPFTLAYRPPDILYLANSTVEAVYNFITLSWSLYDPRCITLIESRVLESAELDERVRIMINADLFRIDGSAGWRPIGNAMADICGLTIVDTRVATRELIQEMEDILANGRLWKTLFIIPNDSAPFLIKAAISNGLLRLNQHIMSISEGDLLNATFSIFGKKPFRSGWQKTFERSVADVLKKDVALESR